MTHHADELRAQWLAYRPNKEAIEVQLEDLHARYDIGAVTNEDFGREEQFLHNMLELHNSVDAWDRAVGVMADYDPTAWKVPPRTLWEERL